MKTPLPFPVTTLTGGRARAQLEPFWELCREWARSEGFPKEHGHFQGTPPL